MSAGFGQASVRARPPTVPGRHGSRWVVGLLCAICAASVAVAVVLGSKLTFFNDDWYFLLQRPGIEAHGGLDVLFAPHNSNSVALTALAYKVLVALFGLGSQLPFRLLLGLTVAAVGVLLFLLVRARVGEVVALACAAIVVFLGAAWEDLLFFASIDLVGSLATGLGALWLLERVTARRNALACLLLICSVGFSNVGVPFAVAAAVSIGLRRRWEQLWVSALPMGLFGLWWVLEGSGEPSHLSGHNVAHLPRYLLDSASAGLASITGLSRGTTSATYTRGHILLGLCAALIAVGLLRGWRPRATLLVPLSAALVFWLLTGASFVSGREPFASRYQLLDAVLLFLIAAELLRGLRVGRIASVLVAVFAIAIVWSNIDRGLSHGYRFLQGQSGFAKAELGALELGRKFAPPNLWLTAAVAHNPYLSGVTAGRFFAETKSRGEVPTYSARELTIASPAERLGADSVLLQAERIAPLATAARPTGVNGCTRLQSVGSRELPLSPGAWLLTDAGPAGLAIGVRRFSPPGFVVYVGLAAPQRTERLTVPQDTIGRPWLLSIRAASPIPGASLTVCSRAATG